MTDAAVAFEWLAAMLDQQIVAASDAGAAAFRAQDMPAAAQAVTRLGELQELQQQFSALQQRWTVLVRDEASAAAPSESEPPTSSTDAAAERTATADVTVRRWNADEFEIGETEPEVTASQPKPVVPHGQKQTPTRMFYRPILQALHEFGGQATIQAVIQRVKQMLEPQFTPLDYVPQPAHPREPRWINSAQWARKELVELGLMLPKRRTGIWEISEAGRRWLAEQE